MCLLLSFFQIVTSRYKSKPTKTATLRNFLTMRKFKKPLIANRHRADDDDRERLAAAPAMLIHPKAQHRTAPCPSPSASIDQACPGRQRSPLDKARRQVASPLR